MTGRTFHSPKLIHYIQQDETQAHFNFIRFWGKSVVNKTRNLCKMNSTYSTGLLNLKFLIQTHTLPFFGLDSTNWTSTAYLQYNNTDQSILYILTGWGAWKVWCLNRMCTLPMGIVQLHKSVIWCSMVVQMAQMGILCNTVLYRRSSAVSNSATQRSDSIN